VLKSAAIRTDGPTTDSFTRREDMPTLTRLVVGLAILGVLAGAAIYALANFVEPHPREMVVRVPPERLGAR